MDKRVLLIGGAPTSGKSYLARKLSEDLKLPWISTDGIRELMRKLVKKREYPNLFMHVDTDSSFAQNYLKNTSASQIVDNQNAESEDVFKGVIALVETDYVWNSFLVEGVAILPGQSSKLAKRYSYVKPVFLVDEDEERIRNIIYTRGLWDDADKYPDSVKEKEVEWVLEFNKWLKKECEKYSLPIVYINDRKSYIEEVKNIFES